MSNAETPDDALRPISVLLIEDDAVDEMATLRTVVLEALPYRVEVARSIKQARLLLAQGPFDVVLADYQLADGTSFDLMEAFGDDLVIFITGAWDEAAAARALRLGVHDYLIKDQEHKYLKLLHYRVESALRQRRTERRLRDSEARLQAILDNAPAAICAHDLSGQLILSNRRHAQLAALTPIDDAPGRSIAALQQPLERELKLTHDDGSQHTYLTVHFPMPGAEGRSPAVGTISVDISARKLAEQQVHQLAYFDPLTGLPNRRMLVDRLQQAFAASARHGHHGAVFYIDLDRFKALNDSLGHDYGDLLLAEVARRLLACVRGEDTVARIGGDEFVVMAVGLAADDKAAVAQAAQVGDKILAAVAQPCQLREHLHRITPSIGVCLFHGHAISPQETLTRADAAMYQSKHAGRGTLRFYDPVMQSAMDSRAALLADLQQALGGNQLSLHYQAQVDGRLGLVGAEALLRWQHPQLGLLLPDQFVPLAEQNGLIVPMGQWVIQTACAQLALWAVDPKRSDMRLAINISPRQFRESGFAEGLQQALMSHRVDPSRLRLELRESLIQDDPTQTLARMLAIKALGVGFAMDDFGISRSSLSLLKRLPLGQIKISQSLLRGLTTDPHDAAIVQTIIGIARDLNLAVLAAGVETVLQQHMLASMGCSLWQGFLFGRPLPSAEFEALRQPRPGRTPPASAPPAAQVLPMLRREQGSTQPPLR